MQASTVRRASFVVCAGSVAGMIVSSIADSDGAAVTFGLVAAVAVLCQMVATSVSSGDGTADLDDLGRRVETAAGVLVERGAEEHVVRALVRDAVRLGRSGRGG